MLPFRSKYPAINFSVVFDLTPLGYLCCEAVQTEGCTEKFMAGYLLRNGNIRYNSVITKSGKLKTPQMGYNEEKREMP